MRRPYPKIPTSASRPPADRFQSLPRVSRAAGRAIRPHGMLRRHNIPVSLSMDTSVWWSGDLFSAMRATLRRGPLARTSGGAYDQRDGYPQSSACRACRQVGDAGWRRCAGHGQTSLAVSPLASKADLVLIKNDNSPVMFPLLHPYGHVVFQAGRGDVHTVMVDGKVVKYDHRLHGADLAEAKQCGGADRRVCAFADGRKSLERKDESRSSRKWWSLRTPTPIPGTWTLPPGEQH